MIRLSHGPLPDTSRPGTPQPCAALPRHPVGRPLDALGHLDALGPHADLDEHMTILDIGAGASCIYPLLACRLQPQVCRRLAPCSHIRHLAPLKTDARVF